MVKRDIAILDIGSMNVCAMVGEKGVNDTFKIKGRGNAEYAGFQNGQFLEPDQVKYALALAISNCENSFGGKISEIVVGVPGEFSSVVCREVSLSFTKRRKINDADLRQLYYVGDVYKKHPTHSVINHTPIYFSLDDEKRVIEPRGMATTRLKGLISYILAENNFLDFIGGILNELGIKKVSYMSSCLAEMLYLFDPSVRDRYAVLVDCGYITTSVMLGRGDGLLFMNSFSMGGGYITGDLSQCLKTTFNEAEMLKRKVVLSWDAKDSDTYEVQGKDFIAPYSATATNQIVEDRVDMIASYINKCLDRCEFEFPDFIPVYLTGGGLNFIKGIKDYLGRKLGRRVELVAPNLPNNNRPDYSSELGLLALSIQNQENNSFLMAR